MKKFVSILITLCIVSLVSAQDIDKKSKVILDKLSSKTKAYNTLRIDFTYKMENKVENIDETIKGTLFMKKNKYRLEFGEQIIISDGITVWTYLKDANEVQIGSISEDDDANTISPQNIFSLYETGHRSKYMREGTYNGAKAHVIELIPIEPQAYHKVRLNIDKESGNLLSAIVFDRNQNTFTYDLNKQIPNMVIPDERFTFNTSKYPNIEIIDLR